MENGLIVGYDLTKDYCRISYYKEGQEDPVDVAFSDVQNPYIIQNSICKRKGQDEWLVGHEAYETALLGGGSIVDKLLLLIQRKGFSTFEGVRYSAEDLFRHYLEETLHFLYRETGVYNIRSIVFSVQTLDGVVLDTIIATCKALGIDRKAVHIISHTECFLFYIISRKRELWSNMAVLYDFSGDGLNFYEMEMIRGMQPNAARAKRTFLEEGISISVLDEPKGSKMADSILERSVERTLAKKLVSSCYLSGNGMDRCQEWGVRFLKLLCQRRRVFFVENLFAKGAVIAAIDSLREESGYPFRLMCEGRIAVDITTEVHRGISQKTVVMAKAGQNWYETKTEFDIIPDYEMTFKMKVKKLGERSPVLVEIPICELFQQRPNKVTRINVSMKFVSEKAFQVTLRDKGFGELFPASNAVIYKTFTVE